MARKKGQRLGEDSDDETPVPVPKGGKGKKGQKLDPENEVDSPPVQKAKGKKDVEEKKGKKNEKIEEDSEEESVPQPKNNKAKGKKGKKGGKLDSDDEETTHQSPEDEVPKANAGKGGKGKDKQKLILEEQEGTEDEEDIPQPAQKGKAGKKAAKGKNNKKSVEEEDEDEEEIPQPVQKGKAAKGGKAKNKKSADEDEESGEDVPQPVQKGKAGKGKKNKKSADEDESSEEESPQPVQKGKGKKGGKGKGKKEEEEDPEPVEIEEEEEEELPVSVQKGKGQKGGKGKEEEELPQPVQKGKGKAKKNKKKGKKGQDDSDDDELPKGKKGGKPSVFSSLVAEEEEEEEEDDEEEEARKAEEERKREEEEREREEERQRKEEEERKKEEERLLKEEEEQQKKLAEEDEKAKEQRREELKKKKEEDKKAKKEKKKNKGKGVAAVEAEVNEEEVSLDAAVTEDRKGSESMSKDIKIEKFDISYPGKISFKNATLDLAHGRKYGLVAPNGVGKSTSLKAIAVREGEFIGIPAHFDIHYVEQEVLADDTPAITKVIQADEERTRLLASEKTLMEGKFDDEKAGQKSQEIHSRLDQIEAYSAEARASAILTGSQFTEEMKTMATKDFSGGWRMRISLARALFKRPTSSLLDEPTNHLDLSAVIWLETYLLKWKNTLLIVSHDQDFLNTVSTDIIHIYQQKLSYYRGNYDHFKHAFDAKVSSARKEYDNQQKASKAEKQKKAKKDEKTTTNKKAAEKVSRNRDKKNSKSNAKGKKNDDDDDARSELLEAVPRDYNVIFEFPDPEALSIPIIQVNNASFGYTPDRILFRDLEFGVDQESRIALVGPNGAGKSTLSKSSMGELEPTTGTVQKNRKSEIGKFSQHFVDVSDMSVNPVQYSARKYPLLTEEHDWEQKSRRTIGRFGLTGKTQIQEISSLSGGQKSRVVFADICMSNPHLLFLDEPTNHLDIESVDALAEALNEFKGGLILVSHDARLIRESDCTVWVVADNTVIIYDGGFDDYRDESRTQFEERLEREDEERRQKEESRRVKREEEMQARADRK